MENWRFIEANSDYMVSDHGRILSFKGKSKLIISSSITAKGYEYVAIRQKGIYVGYSVHRLVATAFIPNPKRLPPSEPPRRKQAQQPRRQPRMVRCLRQCHARHPDRSASVVTRPLPRPLCHNGRGRKYPASLSIHERTGKRGTNEP